MSSQGIAEPTIPTAAMNAHNGWIYFWSYVLIFFSGPLMYIGVLQAALCDRLGANATLANLPTAAFSLGQIAPFIVSCVAPHRLERSLTVWAFGLLAASFAMVAVVLALPLPTTWKVALVVTQGLVQGITMSTSDVFAMQCLGRGTTILGRSQTLKRTFTVTPIVGVAGSLGVQYTLHPGFHNLPFPYDFAIVFALGAVCLTGVSILSRRYWLIPLPDESRNGIVRFAWYAGRRYFTSRSLLLLWLIYFLWSCSRLVTPNISLYSRHVLVRPTSDFSGLMMAFQFGGKAIGGAILGWLAVRWGQRWSIFALLGFLIAGIVWAWTVPGYSYLFSFALVGATVLGGAYIPNFVMTLSGAEAGLTNLSILALAGPLSSFAPALHGVLADQFGFAASFTLALMAGLLAFGLVAKIHENPK